MSRYARIIDDVVVDIWMPPPEAPEGTPADAFHPDFPGRWLACGDAVAPGYLVQAGKFKPPPPIVVPLAELQAAARQRVVAYADALTARITARYPAAEVASWPTRADEAAKVQGGAGADVTPLITALAAASGQTRAEIAATILAKAAAYTAVVVAVSVLREQAEAAIAAAPDEAALAAALDALKQAADARVAELGLA